MIGAAWDLLGDVYSRFSNKGGTLLGGAIAFYSLLSIAPVLVIAIHVASLLASEAIVRHTLTEDLARWVGRDGADTIAGLLDTALRSSSGPLSSVLSIVVLVYASTQLFDQLQYAINHVWGVQSRSGESFRKKALWELRRRSVAFGMVVLVGVGLLGMVILKAIMSAVSNAVGNVLHVTLQQQALENGLSFLVATTLFATIFKLVPEVHVRWRDVWLGSAFTATLFSIGAGLLGMYLGRKGVRSSWGAAGSLVALLLWVHYSAQMFFFGAAFTAEWAKRRGRPIEPNEYSHRVTVVDDDGPAP
ncbi:MAG: YihY/virulence factor BrkB family protein [Myxococcales bacterium]|nr:YihY/virulence factor BrkB family protein [Myxococcales bacterium]